MCAFVIEGYEAIMSGFHTLKIPQPPVRSSKSKNNQARFSIPEMTGYLVANESS